MIRDDSPTTFRRSILLVALAFAPGLTAHGQAPPSSQRASDQAPWNQWRGPGRDGVAPGLLAPADWSGGLVRVWSVEVGAGLSAPVTDGEAVYLFTREGDDEVLAAFALADGSRRWQSRDAIPFEANAQAANPQFFERSKGKGPFATPLVADGRVFTLGVTRLLQARDAATGERLWRVELPVAYDADGAPVGETEANWNGPNYYGAASSPLIHDGTLIVQVGNSQRGQVVGLDPATGERRWTWDGLAVVSSSPVVATIGAEEQLVAVTRYATVGLDPRNGAELWRFALESNAHIATPVVWGDTVIFGTYQGEQIALDVARSADGSWKASERWRSDRRSFVATPVLRGDRLYGLAFNRRGQYYVLDAATGKVLWGSTGREGPNASFVDAGDALLALDAFGALLVLQPSEPGLEIVARYPLSERQTWAHPAVAGSDLVIRDTHELARWRFAEGGEATVLSVLEEETAAADGR
jgi:outer membrane protein assembly factor BamB